MYRPIPSEAECWDCGDAEATLWGRKSPANRRRICTACLMGGRWPGFYGRILRPSEALKASMAKRLQPY